MNPAAYFEHGFMQKCAAEQVPVGVAQYLLLKAAADQGIMQAIQQFAAANPGLVGGTAGALGGAGIGALAGGEENRGTGAGIGALAGGGLGAAAGHFSPDIINAIKARLSGGVATEPPVVSPKVGADMGLKKFGPESLNAPPPTGK